MSGTQSRVFHRISLSPNCYLPNSELLDIHSWKRIPEKNEFICFDFVDFQFRNKKQCPWKMDRTLLKEHFARNDNVFCVRMMCRFYQK